MSAIPWAGPDSPLSQFIANDFENRLIAYQAKPDDITEHAKIEAQVNEGGYAERQLLELVQNARDAIYRGTGDGRITVVLTNDSLYCANEGEPFTESGIRALLQSHMSPKRHDEIGRFGLGFKSVLGISTRIDVFSRTGSIGFGVNECHEAILQRIPAYDGPLPGLRLGFVRDVIEARRTDPILDDLAEWATTVVRLTTDGPHAPRLTRDVEGLPAEFLLFSPRVRPLEIHDHRSGNHRTLRADQLADGSWRIDYGDGNHVDWRINRASHRVSDIARANAGEAVGRDQLEISWATPTTGSRSRGAYWAYFPTRVTGSFGGIANATWKTNPDRQGLLDGAYNQELLGAFANLVLRSLADLSTVDDPGRHLDHLPADPGTGDSWWNRSLSETIHKAGPSLPLVPDATGALRVGKDLKLVPEQATDEMLDAWEALGTDRSRWVHRSCLKGVRRARAVRLGATAGTIQAWLQEIASQNPVASAELVFRIASKLMENDLSRSEVLISHIILSSNNNLHRPDDVRLFIDDQRVNTDPDVFTIHPALTTNDVIRTILVDVFGIKTVDATEVLRVHLEQLPQLSKVSMLEWMLDAINQEWHASDERTWRLARASPIDTATDLLSRYRERIVIRCVDGRRRSPWEVLLPNGNDWQPPGVPNSAAIDKAFHQQDYVLLRAIGVVGVPTRDAKTNEPIRVSRSHIMRKYLSWGESEYLRLEGRGRNPVPTDGTITAGPLSVAASLVGVAREEYIRGLFDLSKDDPSVTWYNTANLRAGHHSLPAPAQWAFGSGTLEVPSSLGLHRVQDCVGRQLDRWRLILPVAPQAAFLNPPATLEKVAPETISRAYERCLKLDDVHEAGEFYAAACAAGHEPPSTVLARVGSHSKSVEIGEALLAHAEGLAARVNTRGPLVIVPRADDVRRMKATWGMAVAIDSAPCQLVGERPAELACDRFSGLPSGLSTLLDGITVVRCLHIFRQGDRASTGAPQSPIDWHWDGASRTFRHVERLTDDDVLRLLLEEAGATRESMERAIHAAREAIDERRADELRAIRSDEARFAAMLSAGAIGSRLPGQVVAQVPSDTLSLARAAFALYGSAVLSEYKQELRAAGFHAPGRWGQSDAALDFVHQYGFDDAFAGEHRTELSPFVDVDGPIILGDLHPYQQDIRQRILDHVASTPPRRALLSLPTGAGKTRVVVEALVDALINRSLTGHVVWVADREELCEQAVQAWRDIWRWRGTSHTLRIGREWGGLDGARAPGSPHHRVVVASVQTLRNRVGATDLSQPWASGAACIVIDEAHASTTTSYTAVLAELGLFRGRTPIPLIGLSATPFRGVDDSPDSETAHLVRRYDSNRLDDGVFTSNDAHRFLRKSEILSEADFEVVDGITIVPNESDLKHFRQFRDFSDRILQAIGQDHDRTSRIIERIAAIDESWPTLVFATSVANAEVLAGLLAARGITARAISSKTDRVARRDAIARFRDGTVRVLTNYGVLTTGFDAPKTRAIVVARPIFSPGLYMQAIGRGLRGPRNGGTDRCLIVNVDDNADRFGERLAFRELEHLWGID